MFAPLELPEPVQNLPPDVPLRRRHRWQHTSETHGEDKLTPIQRAFSAIAKAMKRRAFGDCERHVTGGQGQHSGDNVERQQSHAAYLGASAATPS